MGAPGTAKTEIGSAYAWWVVIVLSFTYAVAVLDRFLMSILVVPLRVEMSLTDTQIGLLSGLGFALLYCTLSIPLGRMADLGDRRRLIAFGVLLWSAATAASAFCTSFETLFAARAVVGLGEAILMPVAMSLLVAYFGQAQLGRATSVFLMGAETGKIVTFLGGAALLSYLTREAHVVAERVGFQPWQVMFLAAALPGLLAALLVLSIREPPRAAAGADQKLSGFFRQIARAPFGYAAHFACGSCVFVLSVVYISWSPSFYVRAFGLDIANAGLLVGVAAFVGGPIGAWCGGALLDRLRRREVAGAPAIVTALGLTLSIAASALFTFPNALALSVLGYGLSQFCVVMCLPASYAGLQMMTSERYRALSSALFHAVCSLIGLSAGPALVGAISDQLSGEEGLRLAIFSVIGVFAALGALIAAAGRGAIARAIAKTEEGESSRQGA